MAERVVENLNQALHALLADDPRLYLLGEDLADPYGGAFKVTRGLSSRWPDRVLSTPLSEGGIVGVAGGLALAGQRAIVEIMFSDFVALAFDQILNFASKSTAMYGRRVPMPLVVRCPTGGNRGYGPTHSQSPQKHFVGIPGLDLYEVSPFHDNQTVLGGMLATGRPGLLFEDKVLYTGRMYADGVVDELFRYDLLDGDVARIWVDDPEQSDCVLVVPGGLAVRAVAVARELLLRDDIVCQVLVPSRLWPLHAAALLPAVARAGRLVVAEESTTGGTWGAELAHAVHTALWGTLRAPVRLVHSADSVIPTAAHLERTVLVQNTDIHRAVKEVVRGA
ncbi:alpha-ketoacid dehydrogenase subunit beta [Micromonospora yasonensis]|uniref:alpha-ketoacid dehydrogenase subunit beta n=1 Tax=Micromonospora yasonensis TaxID=1128667 RepID=UPI002232A080|nr:transketolase C-terminal domain-containing protein [Micromonospora yasonensis]MCW3841243.1 alpha-ketoacid dehydrogenase subunit beta [Micromonospora yasonensis]